MGLLRKSVKSRPLSQENESEHILELGCNLRVIDLKRTRANTQEDTNDTVLLKLPTDRRKFHLVCLGQVRFIHTSPYPRKGKEGS